MLAGELEADLWPSILQAAVAVVPGAEAGSIRLRRDNRFVFVAQEGYDNSLLRVEASEASVEVFLGTVDLAFLE